MISPYEGKDNSEFASITRKLVDDFPISRQELVEIVSEAWKDIYTSSFGNSELCIGKDIFIPAQATGVILEKLIAIKLSNRYPKAWRGGIHKSEKDIVCLYNDNNSFEIKTSSSASGLYGNRSTGHRSDNSVKSRTGYYLVVNYKLPTEIDPSKGIKKIRFGWIDDSDWVGQDKPTGQQASIGSELARLKLITLLE